MNEYLMSYNRMAMFEPNLNLVKADSAKEAEKKFHDSKINDSDMYDDFFNAVIGLIEESYFDWLCCDERNEEFNWKDAMEKFFRSQKGFGDKFKFREFNIDKVINECIDEDIDFMEKSDETKEAIFKWMFESLEALNVKKFNVIE